MSSPVQSALLHRLRAHWPLLIPLVLAAALLFPSLGDRCLWGDEAETALVASTLRDSPVPRVWDGRNLFSIWQGSCNSDLAETLSPWLQYYVAWPSLVVLGKTALAARLPFALTGLLTVAALYFLILRLSRDRLWAVTAATLLSLFVPFLLYMRQCRYYALVALLAVLLLHTYLRLENMRPGRLAVFTLMAVFFFHSNYFLFGCAASALVVWAVLLESSRARRLGLAISALPIAMLTVPWLLYAGTLTRTVSIFHWDRPGEILLLARMYATGLDWFGMFPLVVVLLLPFALIERRDGRLTIRRTVLMLVVFSAAYLVALIAVSPQELSSGATAKVEAAEGVEVIMPSADMRYVTPLLGLSAALTAAVAVSLFRWRPWLGVLLVLPAAFTDLPRLAGLRLGGKAALFRCLPEVQRWVQLDLVSYVDSLRRPYRGAYEVAVDYLRARARPGDLAWSTIPPTVEPLAFHTGLRFANRFQTEFAATGLDLSREMHYARQAGLPEYLFRGDLPADWVIDFTGGDVQLAVRGDAAGGGKRVVYRPHEIETVSWLFARPDLWQHAFISDGPRVPYRLIIYQREIE